MTIEQAQKKVDDWINSFGVRYFNEMTNTLILAEEVGELARIMAVKYGEKSAKEGQQLDLAGEMADILFVLLALANQTGVDLTASFEKMLADKAVRDKDRHQANQKLQD